MATVYLAYDVRHDRKVALKILRPELAAVIGGARFLAEIRTTANLQHPHILALYDSGETDGSVFYVMPFVAGESLRDRLNREKQLPVDDALRIATEVADALDYAHRQGIVHRDIKPENILLHDGRALVADFGIALAVSRSDSSTRMTETGMSLGTPHYMSPEQAMGDRELTARSDVYALGCVLYEMLTGEPPFTGPTAQAIVARVMTDSPRSITAQRHTVPPHVETVVRRALEKLPADRFATAAQFSEALRSPAVAATLMGSIAASPSGPDWRRRLATPLGAIAAVATGLALWGWLRPGPLPVVSRYALHFGESETPNGLMQLSADGSLLVYGGPAPASAAAGIQGGIPSQLWMKARDRAEPVAIPGTAGVAIWALAPDGKSIAAVGNAGPGVPGPLRRLSLTGGPGLPLADSVIPYGLAWLDDGTIVFPRLGPPGRFELWRVSSEGGPPSMIWRADSTGALALPAALPGGRGVLVVRYMATGAPSIWGVDFRSGTARSLIRESPGAQYLESGHLLYARADGSLFAVPFDLDAFEVTGDAIPVMDGVEISFGLLPQFTVSRGGTMVARTGDVAGQNEFHPVWIDRSGRETIIDSTWRVRPFTAALNIGWSLSPDGNRLAIGMSTNGNDDIWVKQLPDGPPTRISVGEEADVRPDWTPDGKSVLYISNRAQQQVMQLFQRSADGSGRDTLLVSSTKTVVEGHWSNDGRWLIVRTGDGATGTRDIAALRPGIDTVLIPLVASPDFEEAAPALSSDSRWLAYESNESGAVEVYIRPFPNTDAGRWQVSTAGGFAPLWAPDGRELFYVTPQREMMVVPVGAGAAPQLGARRRLFTLANDIYGGAAENYTPHDIHPDGSRFIMMKRVRGFSPNARIVVVENLAAELKARSRRP